MKSSHKYLKKEVVCGEGSEKVQRRFREGAENRVSNALVCMAATWNAGMKSMSTSILCEMHSVAQCRRKGVLVDMPA